MWISLQNQSHLEHPEYLWSLYSFPDLSQAEASRQPDHTMTSDNPWLTLNELTGE